MSHIGNIMKRLVATISLTCSYIATYSISIVHFPLIQEFSYHPLHIDKCIYNSSTIHKHLVLTI